jgi:cytosine/adenosine deaminase-related metal-dependent hydrolase
MKSRSYTLAARYLFPVEGAPIADGFLSVRDGRIAEIGPVQGRAVDLDLGNVAITPGFVNAHTHLELSALEDDDATLNDPVDQIEWLQRVISQRRGFSTEFAQAVISRNLAEAISAGTTTLGDITTAGASWPAIAQAPIRAVVFAELIGLKRQRGLDTSHEAWQWISSITPEAQITACSKPGLSPHAPYSTAGWLYHQAADSRLPLTTHLAEMPEELELLERGNGRLKAFLKDLGAWDDDWEPIGPRPADYIRRGDLRKAVWLIAHGNYLQPEDFWQLRDEAGLAGQRVAVAYCPRTHARFGHAPHPFRAMLERGVVVCVGTDSLASTPTLSVLDELRFLRQSDPSLGGELLLTMGTLFGAWALRAETVTGSLKAGKTADLAVIELPDRESSDPYSLLFESDRPVVRTIFDGLLDL